jgi:ABC-type multidrug transport system ATPase subunit
MTTASIEIRNLTKSFGEVRAVDALNFDVAAGTVTGFLGPNGAGKTTTLRMLLGLVRPDRGTATIDGRSYRDVSAPTTVVGAALDATGFHPARTGLAHLRVYCAVTGCPPQRADEVLELVGLSSASRRKIGGYSLGMRQRLALAVALLGDPKVLVLDEPANGLDPEGIVLPAASRADTEGGSLMLALIQGEFAKLRSTRLWLWLLLATMGLTALFARASPRSTGIAPRPRPSSPLPTVAGS